MPASVARVVEISATSDTSFENAIMVAIERANRTLRNITSAWVKEQRIMVEDGVITSYLVHLLVTFVLED
jgi:flavin-binding protein dodecin